MQGEEERAEVLVFVSRGGLGRLSSVTLVTESVTGFVFARRILPAGFFLNSCSRYASIIVNVISSTAIKRYAALHADAAEELLRWNKAASHAIWRDVNEVRLHFPDADQYKSLLIFNIRHNYYRLIVKVDYRAKLLMVKEFLAHKEYSRGGWKKWAR